MKVDGLWQGEVAGNRTSFVAWREWLPSPQQVSNAIQLRFEEGTGETADLADSAPAISMRQGLGLVIVAGLVAGSLPFLVHWIAAARAGTTVPLWRLAQAAAEGQGTGVLAETLQRIAGLEPAFFPGWLAAGLSALGLWLSQPLHWLTLWIVYGLGVLVVLKLQGATTTLQRFYAITSYAAVPLVLTFFSPIPCLGGLARTVGYLWALVLYVQAIRALTGFHLGQVIVAVLVPTAVGLLAGLLSLSALALSLLRILF
ncbi:MAG: hypothetical protein KatS3mg050_3854 [Litorilinea sp.]|nr:MAG: hypothetical protein KatS3mg050_3854 [Litorilinea sp.]